MPNTRLSINRFDGGMVKSEKSTLENVARFIKNMNIHDDKAFINTL